MASILKVDKIRGTGLDSDTMSFDGSGNITIPKNVTFNGTQSGSFIKSSAVNTSISGVASASITGLSTTARIVTLFSQGISTSTSTYPQIRIRGNGADETGNVYETMSWYGSNTSSITAQNSITNSLYFHGNFSASANYYNIILHFYKVGHTSLVYNYWGQTYNAGYPNYVCQAHGRIFANHRIDGFTVFTTDGANFDAGSMDAITQE